MVPQTLGGSKLRAPTTRVALPLFFGRDKRLPGQEAKRGLLCAVKPFKRLLHDPVLKRVEGDNDDPSPRLKKPYGLLDG